MTIIRRHGRRKGHDADKIASRNPGSGCPVMKCCLPRVLGVLATILTVPLLGMEGQQPTPRDQFVTVNGVNLHYLEWGGSGETLLFLAGLSDSVHRFDSFAPKFIDRFRVLG